MKQAHVIGKQKIELTLSPGADAFRLQQNISRQYWDTIVPALQRLFDELCPEEELIRIDSLEINLGALKESQLEHEGFEKLLMVELRKEITRLLKDAISKEVRKEPVILSHFNQWLFFLEKGYLPWQAPAPKKKWLREVLETLGLEYAAVEKLLHTVKNNSFALERLVLQNDDAFLCSLAELYTSYPQKKLASALDEIYLLSGNLESAKAIKHISLNKSQLRLVYWKAVFQQVILERQMQPWHSLVCRFLTLQKDTSKQLQGALNQVKKTEKKNFDLLLSSLQKTAADRNKNISEEQKASGVPEYDAPKPSQQNKAEENGALRDKSPQVPGNGNTNGRETGELAEKGGKTKKGGMESESDSSKEAKDPVMQTGTWTDEMLLPPLKEPKEGTEFYIQHAGLVLLHPFLSHFFINLDLMANGKFKDRSCIDRGIHLIHFLASGETNIPEYALLLPKLLLGVPFEVPVEKELDLTEEELKEAENLLKVAVEHWGALGNTSGDGLREGFLQRQGKLSKSQNGWRLQVEQKTLDVLLDKLPWNINMVKLPLMKEILWVEWR